MAGTPDNQMIDTASIVVVDKKTGAESGFKAPQWERLNKQDSDPINYAFERQQTSPSLSELTKKVGAETFVQEYQAIQKIDPQLLNGDPRYSRYKNFINIIDDLYRQQNNSTDLASIAHDPKALERFMTTLMNDEKNVLWAVKLAEVQMSVFEATTTVHTHIDSESDSKEFVSMPTAMTAENDEMDNGDESVRQLGKQDLRKGGRKGWNKLAIWTRPLADRASHVARAIHKLSVKELREEGRKNSQAIATIDFNENAKLKTNVKIEGRELDEVQKEYIRSSRYLGVIGNDEALTADAKQEVTREVRRKNKMRMNAYAHWGFDIKTGYDFNMVHKSNTLTSRGEYSYNNNVNAPTIVLDAFGMPKAGGVSREVSVGVGGPRNGLERQIARIQSGVQENMADLIEKKRPVEVLRSIEGTISNLEAAKKRRNPERVKEIDAELPKYEELKTYFDDQKKDQKEKVTLETKKKALSDRLNNPSSVLDSTTNLPLSYEQVHSKWTTAQEAISAAEKDKISKESAIQAVTGSITSLDQDITKKANEAAQIRNQINQINVTIRRRGATATASTNEQIDLDSLQKELDGDPANPTSPSVNKELTDLRAEYRQKRNDLEQKKTEKTTAELELVQKKADFETVKQTVPEDVINTINTWKLEIKGYSSKITSKDNEIKIRELESVTKLLKDPNDPSSPKWTKEDIEGKIKELTEEKAEASKPDRNIDRQLRSYKELQKRLQPEALLTTYDRARQSADSPQVQRNLDEASYAHPEYPPSYLYALQILSGKDITLPQSKEAFKNLTTMYTLETHVDLLRQAGQPVTDIYDAVLDNRSLATKVDGIFMKNAFDNMMAEASAGKFGKIPDNELLALKTIEGVNPHEITKMRESKKQQVNTTISDIRKNVPGDEAKYYLATISTLSPAVASSFDDCIQTFESIYKPATPTTAPIPENSTENEVLEYFKTKNTSVSDADAEQIVQKLYGLYNRGEVVKGVYKVSMDINRDPIEALQLAAGVELAIDSTEQEQFMTMVENGKSLLQIRADLASMPHADRPSYYAALDRFTTQLQSLGANPTREEIQTIATNSMVNEKTNIYGPRITDPDVMQEMINESKLLDAVSDRESLELYINQMDQRVYHYEDIDDLTKQLIKQAGLSYNNKDTIRFHKMVAVEIDNRRNPKPSPSPN